jgi:phosphatidylglycerol:prolipoprotein diacylglycerol transferase
MRPILFNLGPLPVKSWGVLVAIAFLVGLFLAKKRAEKKGISGDKIYDFAFYLLISGIIGARIMFVLLDFGFYLKSPLSILMVQDGGMSIHGALIGGFIASYYFCKKNKISLLKLGDIVAPVVLLSQGIGRIGCFLAGICYGFTTKSFLGVRFPNLGGPPRLPTQLFETFFDIIAFGLLLAFEKKLKKEGQAFYVAVILYSAIRIGVEYFRDDMGHLFSWLTMGQAASLMMILAAAFAMIYSAKGNKNQKILKV